MVEFSELQNSLIKDIEKLNTNKKNLTPSDVLKKLLKQIQPVDFYEKLDIEEGGEKPKQKHYVVTIIEEILNKAESNNWGLCKQHDFIYVFNSEFWQVVNKEELKKFLGLASIQMGYKKIECKHYEFRDKLYKQFLSASTFSSPEPPKDKVLINLMNGTVEIKSNGAKLKPFDRKDFLTYQLPFKYDTDAQSPIFNKFINEVLPISGLQNVLSEFMAYIFTKHLKLEKCLLLYGSGANGKSVFFEVMNKLIGNDNISNYSLGNLKEEHNRAMIKNKLLNYGSEIRGNIEADVFKQLVSGEPIQARLKYGNPFIMRDYAKLAFNCNTLPKDTEQTNAYFRRFIIIPFDKTIPEDQQDPMLSDKIISKELSGVFNWILAGLSRLLKAGKFSESIEVKEEVKKYKIQSDSVLLFLMDNEYKPSASEFESSKNLYQEYKNFCIEGGFRAGSIRTFAQRLISNGYEKTKLNGVRGYYIERPQ